MLYVEIKILDTLALGRHQIILDQYAFPCWFVLISAGLAGEPVNRAD